MNQEDFATTPSERQRIWTFRTTHMSRKNAFPPNGKHGIEITTPKIHELVLMDSHTELKYWLTRHPEDIEQTYRQKTPLLILLEHDADVEKSNSKNETALVTAVRLDRINMIEDLIYKGATIYSGDRLARTITEILISRDDLTLSIQFVNLVAAKVELNATRRLENLGQPAHLPRRTAINSTALSITTIPDRTIEEDPLRTDNSF
ncbi:hypothetical protein DAPPUDRAFT_263837 [Daphnia pulex]|uniref:Uncharacterized protein n=1 Tax=Daphnia pulex TaxID=6669 RepID=E9HQH5_DAPPU|nr:hypothetical protein DAPPUDRAFT_263837 [Daphnia pulex]|eukprot:EFX66011.1 hypothetical protein DAPPUDRAFT_263837 [Daphnia pulex]